MHHPTKELQNPKYYFEDTEKTHSSKNSKCSTWNNINFLKIMWIYRWCLRDQWIMYFESRSPWSKNRGGLCLGATLPFQSHTHCTTASMNGLYFTTIKVDHFTLQPQTWMPVCHVTSHVLHLLCYALDTCSAMSYALLLSISVM